MFVGVA